ncbi:MAG: peptidyl-prolyl cis-trans isomerase [Alphaproteobacteria bacterium]|nr:peptidyl-prolyl cis-trans isomerase [Alphaproteobacteria bacterium]
MLQVLREKASSWVIKILLGLLIVAFAIWGINDVFLGERDPAVAKVGGVKIPRSEADQALRDELNRLRPVLGSIDRDTAFRMGLAAQVLNRLVNRTAINLGAHDLGIAVSDQMVSRMIRSDRRFHDSHGHFNRNLFYQALSNANMTEAYYVASLKESMASEQLNGVISANVPVPKALVDPLVRFRSEERSARTVLVQPAPLGQQRDPTAQELEAFYKANTQRFMAPELRSVTFVHIDPAELAKEIQVSEERIKAAYQQRRDEFTLRDRRKVSQVVFRTQSAAQAAAAAVKAGKALAEVAKEDGKSLKVVKLGWVEKTDLVTDIADPVFALKKGETSGVLKSPLGWHIVAVEESELGRVKPLSEVRKQVRDSLALAEAQNSVFALANQLEDALAGGADINAAAGRINLKAVTVPALDSQGRDRAGKAVPNLPIGGSFLRTAFEVGEGELSTLMETQGGGYYILIVNKVTPPEAKPLDEVRSTAIIEWKAEVLAKAAEERARGILDRLKKGEKLEAVAKAEKLEIKATKPFTRLSHEAQSGVPAALAEKLFSLKVGEAAMAESAKGFVVGVLESIKPGAGERKTAVKDGTLNEIREGITADLSDQLVDAFRKRVSITTYPDLLRDRL